MSKFHINQETGEVGKCKATVRACPIGGQHYSSAEAAQTAYEHQMENNITPKPVKRLPADRIPLDASKETDPRINKFEDDGWRARREWRGGYDNAVMLEFVSGGVVEKARPAVIDGKTHYALFSARGLHGKLLGEKFTTLEEAKEAVKASDGESRFYWKYADFAEGL